MKTYRQLSRCWLLTLLALVVSWSLLSLPVAAQSVVQGYGVQGSIRTGMLVRLSDGQSGTIQADTAATDDKLFGVIINSSDADVTLSSGNASQQTYVATSGTYDALVSNQNGPIKIGDYITISSIDGVGMKTGTTQTTVIGKAAAGFDGKTNVINTTTLKTSAGTTLSVSLGMIPISIDSGHNPFEQNATPDLPSFLQHVALIASQKPVSTSRIYLCLVLLVLTTIIVAVILYSGVRNSFVAIGRNPLSKRSIIRGLLQVILVSIAIFIVGLFGVYLLLKA